jgi:hypothetical protein
LKLDNWKIEIDHTYQLLSPAGKIALKTLEAGLRLCSREEAESKVKHILIDEDAALIYEKQPGHGAWLSKLARELKGEIVLKTIDKYLDVLLDQRIIGPPIRSIDPFMHQIMERVEEDGKVKWVRSYYVSNEHLLDLLFMYKATHKFTKTG